MNEKKQNKNILFDWDGCLARTLDVWMAGYNAIFPQYSLYPTDEEIVEKCFGRWDGPKNFGIKDFVGFYDKMMPLIGPRLETVDLYPQVKETLESVKKLGIRSAVLSTSERSYVEKAISKNGLEGYFDVTLFGDEVTKHKPDPEPIFKILEKLRAEPSESFIIGDSDKDILAGKNAGIDSILFYPKENEKFYKEGDLLKLKPTYVIHEFEELIKIIQ